MKWNLRTGDRVTVTDHGAPDQAGNGKQRPECVVRILNRDEAVVFIPRYDGEITFNRQTGLSSNGRMEITHVDRP